MPNNIKSMMNKENSKTKEAYRNSDRPQSHVSDSIGKQGNRTRYHRWDPENLTVEFVLPDAVLLNELKSIEAFMQEKMLEILGGRK